MQQKSFTLIELMVVIAIIGLLASIIFVTLRGAREKAKDARIILDLRQTRSIAELINSADNSYANLVDAMYTLNENAPSPYGDQLRKMEEDIAKQQPGGTLSMISYATTSRYCVSVYINYSPSRGGFSWYCIDSRGSNMYDYWCVDFSHNVKDRCYAIPEAPPP